jgi:hypothetical protein
MHKTLGFTCSTRKKKIPALGRLRQEDHEFEASIHSETLSQKQKQKLSKGLFHQREHSFVGKLTEKTCTVVGIAQCSLYNFHDRGMSEIKRQGSPDSICATCSPRVSSVTEVRTPKAIKMGSTSCS